MPTAITTACLHESGGRRINLHDPDASLLVLKASGRVAHQGAFGSIWGVSSIASCALGWRRALRRMRQGRRASSSCASSRPRKRSRLKETYRLKALATFADGSTEDVTKFCSFLAVDNQVVTVDESGLVARQGRGRYRLDRALSLGPRWPKSWCRGPAARSPARGRIISSTRTFSRNSRG